MTVLVTGGAGYIGSHLVLALIDRGEKVVVLDDLSTGFAHAVPSNVKLVRGDVASTELVQGVMKEHHVREIVHFAARTVVPDSVKDPLSYYEANTAKTRSLISAAVASNLKRFVFSSTAAVYGEPVDGFVSEQTPTSPINPYGRSKLMSEWILADAAAAHGFSYAILRYFNVAGADPEGRAGQSTAAATHLIKVACQVALGQRPYLEVYGDDFPTLDGTGVRDYIQVSDLAAAHIDTLAHLRAGRTSLVLNCGYGRGASVFEVAESLRRVTGRKVPLRVVARRPGDAAAVVADASRIRSELGWSPQFDDLDTITAQAFAWEARLAASQGQEQRKRGKPLLSSSVDSRIETPITVAVQV